MFLKLFWLTINLFIKTVKNPQHLIIHSEIGPPVVNLARNFMEIIYHFKEIKGNFKAKSRKFE
jgi:hypothetical protein